MIKNDNYNGFEQGPIRPPSEAKSLLLRLTRNCPWNFCKFCPVYKDEKFSLRSIENIKKDIDIIDFYLQELKKNPNFKPISNSNLNAFQSAYHWLYYGMESIFLQDANSLIMNPDDLIEVLDYIKLKFPFAKRITSYARSQTISKIKDEKLELMQKNGLSRIHIGLESGSNNVLEMVKKGATKEIHIIAGQKIKNAKMELSEYVMPGLGGKDLSIKNALETADCLNKINPDFIRLRTFAVPYESFKDFKKCNDIEIIEEIKLFIENLMGIKSVLKSDHILNLFEDLEGVLPEDKNLMLNYLDNFLNADKKVQTIYQVGRRLGYFRSFNEIDNKSKFMKVEKFCSENQITNDNVYQFTDEIMKNFV